MRRLAPNISFRVVGFLCCAIAIGIMLGPLSLLRNPYQRLNLLASTFSRSRNASASASKMSARVISKEEMTASEAKWVTLQKINWQDAMGKQRVWEAAERKTRGKAGIDAVAVLAIIRSKTNAFPPSTCIIEQYRPPIDKIVIELPAGLVDASESPEDAAIRELKEETGYLATKILDSTPLLVADPGLTTANMKLVIVDVLLDDKLETPEQELDEGEAIVRRVVALDDLNAELKAYDVKGFAIDAKLSHFATGYEMTSRLKAGNL